MANGNTHRAIAALAVGGYCLGQAPNTTDSALNAVLSGALATFFTNLPDRLEPAIHPHHRQIFHSVVFAAGLGLLGQQIYNWEPEEDWQKHIRHLMLIAGSGYLIHLAVDAVSSRSLPLIGKM